MRNLKLIIEYDGGRYIGWQRQEGLPSIEDELRRAFGALTGEIPTLQVAGRTDAGVHSRAQVVNTHVASHLPLRRFAPGLNHHLPNDISVHEVTEVQPEFNAKRDSLSKYYRYRVYRADQPAALETRAWFIRRPLNIAAMQAATEHLLGERDFNAFRSTQCQAPHAFREMFSITVRAQPRPPCGEHIDIIFHANAFCRHMCRILAGTLVEVGQGKRSPESIEGILASRDRTKAGVTAPPGGLTLMQVVYPDAAVAPVEPAPPAREK